MRLRATLASILLHCHHVSSLALPLSTAQDLPPSSSSSSQTNCSSQSHHPSWSLLNLHYRRLNIQPPCISPSGWCVNPLTGQPISSSLTYGELTFDVVNKATNQTRHCDVTTMTLSDMYDSFGGWMPCIEGIIFILTPELVTDTWFRLNHTSNLLELNQTWTCGGDGVRTFAAYGGVSPVLDTAARYVGNGELGDVRVDGVSQDIDVEGVLVSEA